MRRNSILMTVCCIAFSVMLSAQRYGTVSYTYGNSGYNDGYSDNYRNANYSDVYYRMSRSDRRCLDDLYEKLERRKRRAWRDGYLSNRDINRIRDVEEDIDRIYRKYRRDTRRRNYRRSTYGKCR